MSVHTDPWEPGTPAWVDLMVQDVDAAQRFYGQLFGWEFDEGSEEFGNYVTARLKGHAVAGMGPAQGPDGPPPAWTTYLAADELDPVVGKATDAGGQVLMPAMQVGDFGGMAVLADPTGAVFGLWRSGTHTGADIVNEAGAVGWNDALVGDLDAGHRFYGDVFGYSFEPVGEGVPYETIALSPGGRPVGGIGTAEMAGPGSPPHWRTYFTVDDATASCARARELGGQVVSEPEETEFGTMATVRGPEGEVFLLNQPPQRS